MMNNYTQRDYFTMSDCGITKDVLIGLTGQPTSPIIQKFVDLFMTEYGDNWAVYEDRDVLPWETLPDIEQPADKVINGWKSRFEFTFKTTYDRYVKILNLYEAEKDNLLNKIESATKSIFNDTPQDKENIVTDGFGTTVTTHNTSVDPGEMMDRLKNVERNYSDIYARWIIEFAYLFGEAI